MAAAAWERDRRGGIHRRLHVNMLVVIIVGVCGALFNPKNSSMSRGTALWLRWRCVLLGSEICRLSPSGRGLQ